MPEAIAFLLCPKCRNKLELMPSNTDIHRYSQQPVYNHFRVRCGCGGSHFFWPSGEQYERAFAAECKVMPDLRAPTFVVSQYNADHCILPIFEPTTRHQEEIVCFVAALDGLSPETIFADVKNDPMATLPLQWI